MSVRQFGREVAIDIRRPLGRGPAATVAVEQQVLTALNALHTQATDALPEDHPLVGVLTQALEGTVAACPACRVP